MKGRWKAVPRLWLTVAAVGTLLLGCAEADAAYRLMFRNGTSVEIRSYEDLGDSIRYPRPGGTVVVRKSDLSGIEEATHVSPPTPLPGGLNIIAPVVPVSPPVRFESLPSPVWQAAAPAKQSAPILTVPWQPVGGDRLASGAILGLTAIALVIAGFAVVLFLTGSGAGTGEREGEGEGVARQQGPAGPEQEKTLATGAVKPLGVVLIGSYDVLSGATGVLAGLVGAAAGRVLAELPAFLLPAEGPAGLVVLSFAATVLGAVTLATGYGMWRFQPWGWRLQVIVCFTDIGLNVLGLLARPGSATGLVSVASLIIASAILVYIRRPRIRSLYATDARDLEEPLEPMPDDEPHTPALFDEELERDAQPR